MSRLSSGFLDIDSVTQFAKLVRKIDGRELLKGLPSSVIYRACADAGYDKLYGRVGKEGRSFAMPMTGYVILSPNSIKMLGVDGSIKLQQSLADIPDVRYDASVDWSKKCGKWMFGFWSSKAA